MAEEKRLPGAIRIDLELQASPELVGGFVELAHDEQKIYRYTRVIGFPDDESTALSVRPYLPTKITGRNDNGGANAPGAGGGRKNLLADGGAAGGLPQVGGIPGGDGSGDGGGGQTAIDVIKNGGGGKRGTNFIGGFNGPTLDVHPSQDGKLSDSDQQKIEDFLNDYRNRYTGKNGDAGHVGLPGTGGN